MKVLALLFAAAPIIPIVKAYAAALVLQQKVDFIRDIQPIFQAAVISATGPERSGRSCG